MTLTRRAGRIKGISPVLIGETIIESIWGAYLNRSRLVSRTYAFGDGR